MKSRISKSEALRLMRSWSLLDIGRRADEIRKHKYPDGLATFVIDRNINYTNICINKCSFCAFHKDRGDAEAYVLGVDEICSKIQETIELGGTQILLQGGLNPDLDLKYYCGLLGLIKEKFTIGVHGFSPPEICFLADKHDLTIRETLIALKGAGLDSMPGGGAEMLSDSVRKILSPKKIKSDRWLSVMREAHRLGMRSTATMMFGSIERADDIIGHLDAIRSLQDETGGFTAFIPWPFQPGNTYYEGRIKPATAVEYLRVLSISRIYLDNIDNIQASWVTQGLRLAQAALRFGANDLGSSMIEENVVAAAGVSHRVSVGEMVSAIKAAGFAAGQRDTCYNLIKMH